MELKSICFLLRWATISLMAELRRLQCVWFSFWSYRWNLQLCKSSTVLLHILSGLISNLSPLWNTLLIHLMVQTKLPFLFRVSNNWSYMMESSVHPILTLTSAKSSSSHRGNEHNRSNSFYSSFCYFSPLEFHILILVSLYSSRTLMLNFLSAMKSLELDLELIGLPQYFLSCLLHSDWQNYITYCVM